MTFTFSSPDETLAKLRGVRIVPVIVIDDPADAVPLARALAGIIPPISRDGGGIREDYEYHDDDGLSRKSTKQIRDARGILN